MIYLGMVIIAVWFQIEFQRFPTKINLAVFHDVNQLHPQKIEWTEFIQHSTLQAKNKNIFIKLFLSFIILTVCFNELNILLFSISIILIYLAFIDYEYYLTDSKYIAVIALLSLSHLLFYHSSTLSENLANMLFTALFFFCLMPFLQFILKKEPLGSGDILLLLALSPLFNLEQMLRLMLYASLSGIVFSLAYRFIKQANLDKLPFIPFITFSTFILFLDKI